MKKKAKKETESLINIQKSISIFVLKLQSFCEKIEAITGKVVKTVDDKKEEVQTDS